MAKRKRSAALFEVMVKQEQRRLPKPPGVIRTLYLWFKNRPRPERPAAMAAAAARQAEEAVITGAMAARMAAPIAAPVAVPMEVAEPEEEYVAPAPAAPRAEKETPASEVRSPASRGEVSLRISYGTMIIATFAVATVVVTAFLAGRKSPNVPKTVLAPATTDQLRSQPPRGNLTNVRDVRRTPAPAPAPVDNNVEPVDAAPGAGAAGGANSPARSKERQIGLNYVVIQSYTEEKMAVEMAALVKQNGIDCTVEKGLPLWLKYSVVGMMPFTRVSNNPQLDAYISKIKSISDLYIKNRNSFKAFDPKPFKWQAWTRKE